VGCTVRLNNAQEEPSMFPPGIRLGNRVDHVIWIAKPENAANIVQQLTELFRAQFDKREGAKAGAGFDVWVAWGGGLEVVAPYATGPGVSEVFYEHLQTRGEGFWGLVYGVDNLEEAIDHARALGWPARSPNPRPPEAALHHWTTTVLEVREAVIGEILGVNLLFGKITYAEAPT